MTDKKAWRVNGFFALLVAVVLAGFGIYEAWQSVLSGSSMVLVVIVALVVILIADSLVTIQPNESKVITFFGRYIGSIKDAGLFMIVPLTHKRSVSLRVRNFNSSIIKVNDSKGNPVEIAAVIVYKVTDSAQAVFNVDDYEQFVEIQSESAIRHVASQYPYDSFDDSNDEITLRGNSTEVSKNLKQELQERLNVAGIEITETRLTHLAYATEIANAMLQRQQATAILSARKIIVDGAVSIAEDAVSKIEKDTQMTIDDDKRAYLLNNVLVSIINEKGTQNVINTDNMK